MFTYISYAKTRIVMLVFFNKRRYSCSLIDFRLKVYVPENCSDINGFYYIFTIRSIVPTYMFFKQVLINFHVHVSIPGYLNYNLVLLTLLITRCTYTICRLCPKKIFYCVHLYDSAKQKTYYQRKKESRTVVITILKL